MQGRPKGNFITKGVTFNLEDPDQKELYDYAMQRKNFSGYGKRLIQRDYEREKPAAVKKRTTTGGIRVDLN